MVFWGRCRGLFPAKSLIASQSDFSRRVGVEKSIPLDCCLVGKAD